MDLFIVSIELGLLYSFLAMSVYLTYRVIDFPDLTVDMSSTAGAGTFAVLALSGIHPIISILVGILVAASAGFTSGILHKHLKINPILSGVLVLSIFYTVNLRIMGKPNLSLLAHNDLIPIVGLLNNHGIKILFLGVIVVSVKLFIDWLLKTEYGLVVLASGRNEEAVKTLGDDPKKIKIIVLALAGGIFAIGAILVAQYQGFVDINGGIGNIIVGIAALMLGEAILKPKSVAQYTTAAIVGSIAYELVINITLRLGLASSDIKFFTGLIVILAIYFSHRKNS